MPTHLSPPGTVPTSPTTPSQAAQEKEFNIALIGAGGVGTIAALTLEKSGRARVTAVLRGSYGVVKEKGWDIESVDHGKLEGWRCSRVVQTISDAVFAASIPSPPIPTGAPTPQEPARERYDYILITTKQLPPPSGTDLAILISPLVTPNFTTIVLIQNGLNIHLPFTSLYQYNVTISAVSMIGSYTSPPNKINHIGHDILQIGPHYHAGVPDKVSLERAKTFVKLYAEGGAKSCTLVEDMPRARWTKLLWNSTYNPICALENTCVGEVQRSGARESLVLPIMRELQAVAEKDGVKLEDEVLESMVGWGQDSSGYRPSMLLDREKGRPMEFEALLGDPIRRGGDFGVQTPVLSTVYELMKLVSWKMENGEGKGEDIE